MKEFLLVIHRDLTSKQPSPSPEQMKEALEPYRDWINSLFNEDKLANPPKRWDTDGRFVKQDNNVNVGPYAEVKESIGAVLFIKADDYDEAVEIAKGCPIIQYGAIVEVRMNIQAV